MNDRDQEQAGSTRAPRALSGRSRDDAEDTLTRVQAMMDRARQVAPIVEAAATLAVPPVSEPLPA